VDSKVSAPVKLEENYTRVVDGPELRACGRLKILALLHPAQAEDTGNQPAD